MKKITLKDILTLLAVSLIVLAGTVSHAQTRKRDSLKFDTLEVQTLYRNQQIIQSQLHTVHLDAVLRDKLDSVYSVNVKIIEGKFLKPAQQKKGKGK